MQAVTKEAIERAKQVDLLTYLQNYEPYELVRESRNVYSTRTHDSLKISNGMWCWWSRDIGGRSALDYLIKVRGMTLPEAVIQIEGQAAIKPPVIRKEPKFIKEQKLILPSKNENNDRVKAYLQSRGVHYVITDYLIKIGQLYEDKYHHNAVFIGYDNKGTAKYALMRGTTEKRFFGEVPGSDKHFSFSLPSLDVSNELHIFESAIDLISFATIELFEGRPPYKNALLSLAGVYLQKEDGSEPTIPMALSQYLKDHTEVKSIRLHLDNDEAGRSATKALISILKDNYKVSDEPPKSGKDYNDFLCKMVGLSNRKKEVNAR